jgi:transcriptional regulator with XRE-family HTH domain
MNDISSRLLKTREALGLSQAEFCRQIAVERNLYNPFEKGRRRIPVDVALRVKRRFNISLDWIYAGDPSQLSTELYGKLAPPSDRPDRIPQRIEYEKMIAEMNATFAAFDRTLRKT